MATKIIVTNRSALRSKYGVALSTIDIAIDGLISADRRRGVTTTLIELDSSAHMAALRARPVTNPKDPAQNKSAVDAVFTAKEPDYLLILGSVDIVPHQDLDNPCADADPIAFGDLPYSCAHGYSRSPSDFVGPTRVVGRLPDLTASNDPSYLSGLLNTAAAYQSRERADYSAYFSVTAEVWKKSTEQSLKNIFGTSSALKVSPPDGSRWPLPELGVRSHFVNCHGSPADPHFYGQLASSYPVAHEASYLPGKIVNGTVASCECCYGAELYDPNIAGQMGICNAYLAEQAYGFFGSSTIAYGPAVGNSAADLICQHFLIHVLRGASIGRAALQARLDFIKSSPHLTPIDLKTLAQFSLLGDPSVHPVKKESVATLITSKGGMFRETDIDEPEGALTRWRRQSLAREGMALGESSIVAIASDRIRVRPQIQTVLANELQSAGASVPQSVQSFELRPADMHYALAAKAMFSQPGAMHLAIGEVQDKEARFPQFVAVLATESQAGIVVQRLYSR